MVCQLQPKPGAAPASAKAEKESCVFNPVTPELRVHL